MKIVKGFRTSGTKGKHTPEEPPIMSEERKTLARKGLLLNIWKAGCELDVTFCDNNAAIRWSRFGDRARRCRVEAVRRRMKRRFIFIENRWDTSWIQRASFHGCF